MANRTTGTPPHFFSPPCVTSFDAGVARPESIDSALPSGRRRHSLQIRESESRLSSYLCVFLPRVCVVLELKDFRRRPAADAALFTFPDLSGDAVRYFSRGVHLVGGCCYDRGEPFATHIRSERAAHARSVLTWSAGGAKQRRRS